MDSYGTRSSEVSLPVLAALALCVDLLAALVRVGVVGVVVRRRVPAPAPHAAAQEALDVLGGRAPAKRGAELREPRAAPAVHASASTSHTRTHARAHNGIE